MVAAVIAVLAACASPPQAVVPPGAGAPANTGTFPNLNVPPQVAAPAITEEEKTRLQGEIGGARGAQGAPGRAPVSPAEAERIRKLATTHADDTLKEIAAQ